MNPIKDFLNEVEAKVLETRTDVISLITCDHRKVDQLFEQYIQSSERSEKENILKEVISDLKVHFYAEENKVYPSLDQVDHDGCNESLEEHRLIKILIEELSGGNSPNDKVDAKVKVLSEVVKHHIKEEENKYLPELKDSGADLDELAEQFTSEKERLKAAPQEMEEKFLRSSVSDSKKNKHQNNEEAGSKREARSKRSTAARKAPTKKSAGAKKATTPKKMTVAKKKAAPVKKATVAKKKAAPVKKATVAKRATTKKSPTINLNSRKAAAQKKAS